MLFRTKRTNIELLAKEHAHRLHEYYSINQVHLAPWEPAHADGYHSAHSWKQRAVEYQQEHERGVSLRLVAFEHDDSAIVGVCNFTNIARGPFQACNLGYSISRTCQGRGLMSEIVSDLIEYVFEELDLHRIMANYVPENDRSARLLEKLGFEEEGYAKSYLQIAGRWRDHVLTAKINPNHPFE